MPGDREIKLIMDSSLDAIVCLDAAGTITFWNAQAEKMFGWRKEEIINKHITRSIISPQFLDQFTKEVSHCLEDRNESEARRLIEITGLNKSGAEFPIEMSFTPIKQKDKVILCTFIRDISERKKTEQALQHSQQKYYALLNTIDVIVWEVDVNTFQFTYVSSQAEKMLGYPVENWIKEPNFWAQHIHPDDREWALGFCAQSTKKKGTYSFEYRMIAADNRVLWLRDVVTVIVENDQPRQLRGILMDVTESRKLEESLRKAEEQYRSIFENAAEGIYQSTPEGKLITANPALAKMFGYTSAEELINSVTDIGAQFYVNVSDRMQVRNLIEKDGSVLGFEFKSFKKNGEIIWVRDHIRAIYDKDKNIRYYEGTLEDITERKMAEDRLRTQLEEVQKTNYELDHFVYSVSHDLRAPVATLLGLINIAEKETLTPDSRKHMEMMRESINRMDGFIKDILDYSRNSRQDIGFEKINFYELIEKTQSSLKMLPGADRLKIAIETDGSDTFYSDSARISVILKNIFSNAIKYQDTGKESVLSIRIVFSPEKAVITFRDNGIGIEQNQLEKIFQMFYRGTEKSIGAGLGLYITKEIVGKLGGTMKVQSELGVFTTFEISIPNLDARVSGSVSKKLAEAESIQKN